MVGPARPREEPVAAAALEEAEIKGPAEVLMGYLPDLERDVRRPLAEAGYGPERIAELGEGLGG